MTAGPEEAAGDPAVGPRVVMHGQAHDDSTFKQTGIEVNIKLPPVPAVPEVRYSLPPDTAAFTGRGEELSQVTAALAGAPGTGGVVAVRAIDGMPGAGKTALAVHAAHMLRDRFPDRQLFIDLHAHTPGREPVRPEDALAALLTAAGVDPRNLPGDLEGRAAMWRDKMAGQRGAARTGQRRQYQPCCPAAAWGWGLPRVGDQPPPPGRPARRGHTGAAGCAAAAAGDTDVHPAGAARRR
jgi:hypothetical protein